MSVSVDFIAHLSQTSTGKYAIVVFVDRLSKMVHIAACTTTVNAEETARSLPVRFGVSMMYQQKL